jgi:hypothetical protein
VRFAAILASRACIPLTALALMLFASGPAAAAPPCWKQIQDEYTDNHQIYKTYAAKCYDKAIAKLPTDLKYYSEAPDVIRAAKERMLRENLRELTGHDTDNTGVSNSGPGGTDRGGGGSTSGGGGESPVSTVLNWGPSAADDVPLPLLVIALLALLLMGAGAAGLVSRHLQTRRLGTAEGPPPDGPNPA